MRQHDILAYCTRNTLLPKHPHRFRENDIVDFNDDDSKTECVLFFFLSFSLLSLFCPRRVRRRRHHSTTAYRFPIESKSVHTLLTCKQSNRERSSSWRTNGK